MTPEQVRAIIRDELSQLIRSDRYTFQKNLQIQDGRSIQLGTTTGTRLGTASTQKLGFYGATPVARQGSIPYPVFGATIDSQARTAVTSIITAGVNLGFWTL